jgi:hypothetical protein
VLLCQINPALLSGVLDATVLLLQSRLMCFILAPPDNSSGEVDKHALNFVNME